MTEIKEETLSQVDASTTQGHSALPDGMSHEVLQGTNSSRGSSDAGIIPKSGQNGNGLAKMSVGRKSSFAQPSLFDQIYQSTFDFNRPAEEAKQQELDFGNEKPTSVNEKQPVVNEKQPVVTDKIEDVGEKISGARKDVLKSYVSAINDATREQLYALPFSKAFKKPDFAKAVQTGALREEDARFYDTVLATIAQKKPIVTAKDERMKRYRSDYVSNLDRWVENTQNALSIVKLQKGHKINLMTTSKRM